MKFEEILVIATVLAGIICLIDSKFLRAKRFATDGGEIKKEPIIIEYARSFFPVLLLVLLLRSFLAEPFRIPSGSMMPTLLNGDFILVNKFTYGIRLPILGTKVIAVGEPERGDVVVFRHHDRKDLIKRVVGLPGDKIRYENKRLYVNDEMVPFDYEGITSTDHDKHNQWTVRQAKEKLNEHEHTIYLADGRDLKRDYRFANTVVPEGKYFVMGDNRDNSHDSRFWGFVDDKDLLGRAFATWFSWDGDKSFLEKFRLERFGKSIK